jgi:hypothetical protein
MGVSEIKLPYQSVGYIYEPFFDDMPLEAAQ